MLNKLAFFSLSINFMIVVRILYQSRGKRRVLALGLDVKGQFKLTLDKSNWKVKGSFFSVII
ncbi:hypothetical protein SAMN04488089_1129 [Myroides profundi]|uniref:Uncharacterized protein n=1 Tax=Myroides profundi TaxID=480520 RepID=A0AAJ5BES1_MYRPR|nr:hypothetical protein SAMN04488089_1129 [Myroides profundi]